MNYIFSVFYAKYIFKHFDYMNLSYLNNLYAGE